MFFASIIIIPILAGLVAGTVTTSRRAAHSLAAVAVAVAMGLDADTTDRGSAIAFGVVAGVVGALLVYGGWAVARALRARRANG